MNKLATVSTLAGFWMLYSSSIKLGRLSNSFICVGPKRLCYGSNNKERVRRTEPR